MMAVVGMGENISKETKDEFKGRRNVNWNVRAFLTRNESLLRYRFAISPLEEASEEVETNASPHCICELYLIKNNEGKCGTQIIHLTYVAFCFYIQ